MILTAERLKQAKACNIAAEIVKTNFPRGVDTEKVSGDHDQLRWLGHRKITIDTEDRVVRVENSDGRWKNTSYDAEGRVVRVENSDGEVMDFSY